MPFQLPQNLLMLGRTVGVLSGMCAATRPALQPLDHDRAVRHQVWSTDEGISDWKTWLDEAAKVLTTLIALPGRTDRLLTTVERGELEVRTPQLDRRAMHLERSVNRVAGGVVFAGLLVAGATLYSADPDLGRMLMVASALPLLWTVFFARGHRPRR
jgi:predicted unusual protein kinase regulating ubiquinone biosynthesis (AarF/ABC1/UbiB family)